MFYCDLWEKALIDPLPLKEPWMALGIRNGTQILSLPVCFLNFWSILTKMGLSGDTEGSWCHWFRSHEATAFISSKGKIRTELREFKGPGCSQMWASRQGRKLPRGTVSWSKCCCLPRVPLPMAAQGTSDSRVLKLSCILKRKIDASELRKRDCT